MPLLGLYGEKDTGIAVSDVKEAEGNDSTVEVNGIVVRLTTPFVLDAGDEAFAVERLGPQETATRSWRVRALSPLESGSLRLTVDTINGGGISVPRPFKVVARSRPLIVSSVVTTPRSP